MDNKVYVDSEQLTSVAASIKVKANNILNIFQGDCSSAIILGKECLQVSGLDTTAIINSLNKIFTNLSTRINTLSDFLTQKVAGEYDLTSQSIINAFNGNFATELAALLGLTVGTTVVPGVTGNGAGTAGSTGGIATGIIRPSTGGSSGGCSTCVPSDTQDQAEHLRTSGTSVWLSEEQVKMLEKKGYNIIKTSNCPGDSCWYEIRAKDGDLLLGEEVEDALGIGTQSNNGGTGTIASNNGVQTPTSTEDEGIKSQEINGTTGLLLSKKEVAILKAKGYEINENEQLLCDPNTGKCYYEVKSDGNVVESTQEINDAEDALKINETSAYWTSLGDRIQNPASNGVETSADAKMSELGWTKTAAGYVKGDKILIKNSELGASGSLDDFKSKQEKLTQQQNEINRQVRSASSYQPVKSVQGDGFKSRAESGSGSGSGNSSKTTTTPKVTYDSAALGFGKWY
ncbi:MAG: hypothetical protein IJB83_00285 [Bacilli bacterium]|nr:hypothetical protein [Bacilli bacterium]